MSSEAHRQHGPRSVAVAWITVSDTRTAADDEGGAVGRGLLEGAGHVVRDYRILQDDPQAVRAAVLGLAGRSDLRAVILSGGTGISPRDRTYEAIASLLERRLDGFGELFRSLSYEEIGAAAMLSRAIAGLVGEKVVFSIPGSTAAVRLALEKLILPELGHLISEIDKSPGRAPRDR